MSERPTVAIVSNSLTPYRLHLHRRIVREMPEIRLASVFTHGESNSPWRGAAPPDIAPVEFGPDEPSAQQSRPRFAFHEWRKGGRIIAWLREHGVRAVVVLGYNDPGRIRLIRWCRRNGIPCFLFGDSNIRGDRATGLKRAIKSASVPRILSWCTGVLCCGSLGREYFQRYGVPGDRIFEFPYEPDYDRIRHVAAETIDEARRRFALDPERRRIVYSGRLAAEKRVDLLLSAFAALAAERPNWDLILIGGGPLARTLPTQVPQALANRVQWAGFIDNQDLVSAVYRCCDVLALPSDYEPWAVVVSEALAAGLAVVASDMVGAAPELVHHGVNGYVFPHGDVAGLAVCLREVTAPGRTEELRRAAPSVLEDWRRRSDPVAGLRRALQFAHVIGSP